jgi:hypothetical protein
MTDQFRIEKIRLGVTVRLRGCSDLSGCIFAQPSLYMRDGPEGPADILNSGDAYFPMLVDSGETVLLAKRHVIELIPGEMLEIDELRRASAREVKVELLLEDGTLRQGALMVEMPQDRPRVLDFLNNCSERFFMLMGENQAYLINFSAVVRVSPVE